MKTKDILSGMNTLKYILLGFIILIFFGVMYKISSLFTASGTVSDTIDEAKEAYERFMSGVVVTKEKVTDVTDFFLDETPEVQAEKIYEVVTKVPIGIVSDSWEVSFAKMIGEKAEQPIRDLYNAPTWAITETRDWATDKIRGWW